MSLLSEFDIVVDERVGRALQTRRNHSVGEVLWTEHTFVFATDEEDFSASHLELIESAFPETVMKNLNNILDEISQLDCVQCLGTAKNFVLLLAITILKKMDYQHLLRILMKIGQYNTAIKIQASLENMELLTACNLQICLEGVKSIRESFSSLIPKSLSSKLAAKLLGILNTNQLELDIGGSGLFPHTSIVQHSCCPNCSFTTNGPALVMVATVSISPGERLSIDYGNHFYHSTPERIRSLQRTYCFVCCCEMCIGPDVKRGFKCRQCPNGVVYPIGAGEDPNSLNYCHCCQRAMSPNDLAACYARETYYSNKLEAQEINFLSEIQSEELLFDTHYLRFWALDSYANRLIQQGQEELFVGSNIKSQQCYQEAKQVLLEALRLIEITLPTVHHEKVVYWDKIAQVAVALNEIATAKEYFGNAYRNSCLVSGAATAPTLVIKEFFDKPPTSTTELYRRYQK